MNSFVERRWTSRDGLSLYARDYAGKSGDARLPVVCLHGLTRSSRDFEDLAPEIAKSGRRVLVPDVRGRGLSQSDPNPRNYNPSVYVRDILELLESLGIARAIFIGTSMGGLIIMLMAGRQSHRIAAAILNDVGPEVAPEGIERIKSYAGKTASVQSWDDATSYVRTINEVAFPQFGQDDWQKFAQRTFREQKDGTPALNYDPAIAVTLAEGGGKFPSWLAWLLYRRLARRPTLIIRGKDSDILSAATARKMQLKGRSATLVEVPGVGHAPMLNEPVAGDAITAFLETVP